ncbi:hypothetical protein AGMMS49975_09060 [Clostridia bacterium]|nr:hypothetical protein AGMMS49975_09060 [Clostridia bacterium]
MLQTQYGYNSQRGVPGGLFDSSPRSVISRANGETTPIAIKFGYGVVKGTTPGVDVVLPTSSSTADEFEGVVLSDIAEHDIDGKIRITPTRMIGVMDWGKVWVIVPDDLTIAYGDAVYLINDGDDAGKFTNDSDGGIAVKAKFITAVDSGDIAVIQLFNQSSDNSEETNAAAIVDIEATITALTARVAALENA